MAEIGWALILDKKLAMEKTLEAKGECHVLILFPVTFDHQITNV